MTIEPKSVGDLQKALREANASGQKIAAANLRALNCLVEHAAEDMTATVQAGAILSELQRSLATHRQWLPIDPPRPEQLTVGELLSTNASGPRRLGHGTIRDYLLGVTVALANGELIHAGGKVVKNVAGYDLGKLFIGTRSALGIIVEATFKLKPLPEQEEFVEAVFDTLEQAGAFIESVMASALEPVVFDLHNLAAESCEGPAALTAVLGFAGASEDVAYQKALARELGAARASSLEYHDRFWSRKLNTPPNRRSVLPSTLIQAIERIGPVEFVARVGNGLIEYRGVSSHRERPAELVVQLSRRVKDAFDPGHILPDLPL